MAQQQEHPSFSSRIGFILVTAGAAVGLGNVWSFTYVAGKNGGGGFMLIYLLTLIVIATPVFMAELLLGRMGKASPTTALKNLQQSVGSKLPWRLPAWLGLASTILILSFYCVIAGQVMAYGFEALQGGFAGWSPDQVAALDKSFKAGAIEPSLWAAGFMALSAFIVSAGVRGGLERTSRYLMPALFAMLVGLVIYAGIKGDFDRAVSFLFGFNEMKFSPSIFMEAVGQAFFTLSVGVGGIMIYGSYMGKDVNLPKATLWIVTMDLLVALLAGMAIFPLLFAHNMDPAVGPGLVFVTLPLVFSEIPGGAAVAFIFFLLLTFAAITSSIALMSPATQRLIEAGWSRAKAAWLVAGLGFSLSIFTTLSFNEWKEFYPLAALGLDHHTFFDLIREGVNNIVLPFGGLAFALMIGWGLKRADVQASLPMSDGGLFSLWYGILKFLVPVAIVALFISVI
jgi:NSS family neurotransmitter:Na+ symporter